MHDISFKPLLIVMGLAWILPIISYRIRILQIPSVILEILAGVIIGKSGFDLIQGTPYLEFLSLAGFVFLMFLSGLEIDMRDLMANLPRKNVKSLKLFENSLMLGIIIFIFSIILALIIAYFTQSLTETKNFFFFALIMATTSVGIVVPTLKQRGIIHSDFGQNLVVAAVIADISTIFLITITSIVIQKGFNVEAVLILLSIPGLFILYLIARIFTGKNLFQAISNELSHASSQIKVRGTIFLIMLFLVLTEVIGAEFILGGFFAGVIMSIFVNKERSALILKLDGMSYGFFIPIFFIMVGVNLDLVALEKMENSTLLIIILIVSAFLIKLLPSLLFKKKFGFKKAIAGGFLMSSRLSLIIAAGTIGLKLNIISEAVNAVIILLAWVTCFISPTVFNKLIKDEDTGLENIIIIGAGKIGRHLALRLKMHDKASILLENDSINFQKAKKMGLNVIDKDACNLDSFADLDISEKTKIVILTGSDDKNMTISQNLKEIYKTKNIIARDNDPASAENLKRKGIKPMNLVMSVAIALENMLFRPSTYNVMVESFDQYEVQEIELKNKTLFEKFIKEVPLPKDGFLLIINRNRELRIPHGDTKLKPNDMITVFGTYRAINEIKMKFEDIPLPEHKK